MAANYPGLGIASLIKQYVLARSYQRQAYKKHLDERFQGIVSLPTGAGKTLIGTMAIATALGYELYPVLVMTPTRALVDQWVEAINLAIPGVATKDPSSWGRNGYPVLVTTYQYVLNNKNLLSKAEYVVVDEAHHIRLGPNPSYRELAVALATKPYKLGLTPVPGDLLKEMRVTRVLGPVVYSASIKDLQGFLQGFLTDIRLYKGVRVEDVPADLVVNTVKELIDSGRKKIIVFSNTFTKAREIAEELRKNLPKDYKVLELYGSQHMKPEEQAKTLKEYKEADKAVLVGTTVLNEGINIPESDAAVIATPTGTAVSNIQRIGRVIRPSPGKGLVPVIYLVPEQNKKLVDSLEELISRYYGSREEKEMAKEVSELAEMLKPKEKRLAAKISTLYYPVPRALARYVADLLVDNPKRYDTLDSEMLQQYLYYYYLNIYGDPGKAYKAWVRDIVSKSTTARSIRDWILSPGPRPSPEAKIPGKDLEAVDYGDTASLENLAVSEQALSKVSKEFKKVYKRLEPEISGIVLSSKELSTLKKQLSQLPQDLRDKIEKLLLLPLSALGEKDVETIMMAKAVLSPKSLINDVRYGYAGFCTVAAWLMNKCQGIPPAIRKSRAREIVKKVMSAGVEKLLETVA